MDNKKPEEMSLDELLDVIISDCSEEKIYSLSSYLFDKLPLEDNPDAEAAWDHFVNDYAPEKDRAVLREAHRKNQRLRRKGLL